MVINRSSDTILNPAYNKKYAKFLEPKMKQLHISNKTENGDTSTIPEIVGVGGVGSNLLYMLRNYTFGEDKDNINFFEHDKWELSNMPRIPISVGDLKSTLKQDSLRQWGTNHKLETDFIEPLFLEGCHNKQTMALPIGAMDIRTRKVLHSGAIPFITITHKDDELIIKLCEKPVAETSIVNESYGKIDLNFMLPATHMASQWLMDFLDPNSESEARKVYNEIDKWKRDFHKVFNLVLDSTDSAYSDAMYKLKTEWEHWEERKGSSMRSSDYDEIRIFTYCNLYRTLLSEDGRRKVADIVKYEGEVNIEGIEDPIIGFERMQNRELLKIKKADVAKWLKKY